MEELRAHRLGEALDRVLGAAVGSLQGDAAICERRAHLDDNAPALGLHPPKRRHGAPYDSQVGDGGSPGEFLRLDLRERGKDRGHRVVDPDVDRAQLRLHRAGGRLDLLVVRHVGRYHERLPAGPFHVARGALERIRAARDQRNSIAATGEGFRGRPAEAPVTTTTLLIVSGEYPLPERVKLADDRERLDGRSPAPAAEEHEQRDERKDEDDRVNDRSARDGDHQQDDPENQPEHLFPPFTSVTPRGVGSSSVPLPPARRGETTAS